MPKSSLTRRRSCGAGHLYAPNDYQRATELARELVLDEQKRKAMATAARAHVEKLGWMAAVKRIRDTQYQRAITTFRAHKRSAPVASITLVACNCHLTFRVHIVSSVHGLTHPIPPVKESAKRFEKEMHALSRCHAFFSL